jgi:hypothetical protein
MKSGKLRRPKSTLRLPHTFLSFFYVINHGYTIEQVIFLCRSPISSPDGSSQTNRIFAIAKLSFDGVSKEDKKKYESPADVYRGYKPRRTWVRYQAPYDRYFFTENQQVIKDGVKDEIEYYNCESDVWIKLFVDIWIQLSVNKDLHAQPHPPALQPFTEELEQFAYHNHVNVIHPIMRFLTLLESTGVQSDEETIGFWRAE